MAAAVLPKRAAAVDEHLAAGGGGCRVTECSETAKGSPMTATSSLMSSGTGMSIDSWAGR